LLCFSPLQSRRARQTAAARAARDRSRHAESQEEGDGEASGDESEDGDEEHDGAKSPHQLESRVMSAEGVDSDGSSSSDEELFDDATKPSLPSSPGPPTIQPQEVGKNLLVSLGYIGAIIEALLECFIVLLPTRRNCVCRTL
jgi:hypothetical protein